MEEKLFWIGVVTFGAPTLPRGAGDFFDFDLLDVLAFDAVDFVAVAMMCDSLVGVLLA